MIADGIQKQQFQARLKRVAAGGANTMSQMYAGTLEPTKKRRKSRARGGPDATVKARRSGASLPVSLISGLLIGAGAVVLARYARFELTGGALTGPNADVLMLTDIVVAITIAIILRVIFRFRSGMHGFAKLAGVVAMVVLMHNTVYIAPGIYERIYSVQWVQQVISTTTPNTVLLAGVSYQISPQPVSASAPYYELQ